LVNAVLQTGATPILVDVNLNTFNISGELVQKAITPKTKAIIPVHLYGNPCNMGRLNALAARYNIPLIEDCAQALGSRYYDTHVGNIGDYGTFSFNGNKTITTGKGGAITSKQKILAKIQNESRGNNDCMSELSAALGLAQFQKLDKFIQKKLLIDNTYREILPYKFQQEERGAQAVPWMTVIKLTTNKLQEIQAALTNNNIPTKRLYKPLHMPGANRPYRNSTYLYNHCLVLPSSTKNTLKQIEKAAHTIKGIVDS